MANIDKLATSPVFAVVTGQQVGILTGPLYTIYKAMTTVKLAQKLNEKFDAEFVPIFWWFCRSRCRNRVVPSDLSLWRKRSRSDGDSGGLPLISRFSRKAEV